MDGEPDSEARDTLPDVNQTAERLQEFDRFLMEYGGVNMDHTTGKYEKNGLLSSMERFGLTEKEQAAYLDRQEARAAEQVRIIQEALNYQKSRREALRREAMVSTELDDIREEVARVPTVDHPNRLPHTTSDRVGLNAVQLSPKAARTIQDEILSRSKGEKASGILGKIRSLLFGRR